MEMKKEEKVNSTQIYKGRIIDVYKDEVICPNGRHSTRELIRHRGAACVVALHNGKVIMERQYRYPYDEMMIEVPAGKLEQGEEIEECARRELEEETGFHANKMTYIGKLYPTVAYSDEVIHMYIATDLVKTKTNWDEDENIDIYEEDIETLINQVLDGTIKDSKTIACLCKYYILKDRK